MDAQTRRSNVDSLFLDAERAGLKLAIKGRLVALFVVGIWLVWTRGADRTIDIMAALLLLVALGLLHFRIIGTSWERRWVKYAFLSVDLVLISAAAAFLPPEPGIDLPQIFMFRFDVFPYYYVVLAVAAFSFSPGLMIWSGVVGAAGWYGAFLSARAKIPDPLEWDDVVAQTDAAAYMNVFLDDRFVGTGSRVQEALIYLVVALLFALVMYRARRTVHRQIEAERETSAISQIFGRFVPQAVADRMIQDRGVLDPVERQASVLFVDIVGFTNMTQTKGPRSTVDILNAYFDMATDVIGKHRGVVTQFQGDAILAVFNAPVENEGHARSAFDAALEILEVLRGRAFAGERLSVRIGLNTGPVVAGNVGGGGRQSYTVHGDAVNLAARLESLNKDLGTSLLASEALVKFAGVQERCRDIGSIHVRGHNGAVRVFTTDLAET